MWYISFIPCMVKSVFEPGTKRRHGFLFYAMIYSHQARDAVRKHVGHKHCKSSLYLLQIDWELWLL